MCASPRNSTWFTRPFLLMRGWGLGTRLILNFQERAGGRSKGWGEGEDNIHRTRAIKMARLQGCRRKQSRQLSCREFANTASCVYARVILTVDSLSLSPWWFVSCTGCTRTSCYETMKTVIDWYNIVLLSNNPFPNQLHTRAFGTTNNLHYKTTLPSVTG